MKIDENGHNNRIIDYKTKKTQKNKNLVKSLSELIMKKGFDIFRTINEIFRQLNNRIKKL